MSRRPAINLNPVDRIVSFFDPAAGLRRASARHGLQFLAGSVSRTAAGTKGTLGNWFTRRLTRYTEGYERTRIADRAEDLVANSAHAASIVDATAVNVVGGVGLTPQSKPAWKMLGITEEQANEVAEQAEYWFGIWSRQAGSEGEHFSDIQNLGIRSGVTRGEYLHLPVQMETGPNRQFNLAIQVLDSRRLRSPFNLVGQPDIRDGIRLGSHGEKLSYFVANPDDGYLTTNLTSQQFSEIPALRGHRPGILHGFLKKEAEQVRGISAFAPCAKLFRDFDDYMDFEIVGSILANSFPVFIETPMGENPSEWAGQGSDATGTSASGVGQKFKEVTPGQIMYGQLGQKPHILKGERQNPMFAVFVETFLRAMGAAVGLPYEIVAKDFSKTNYSSARAALLEAWRFFCLYQSWLVNHHNQPIWEMVFEEAWLRGFIKLPKGSPDFYLARQAWTAAKWTPPKRGWVDPTKEVASGLEATQGNLGTLADWYAEQGEDWREALQQIAREKKLMEDLGITTAPSQISVRQLATQPEQGAAR